MKNLPYIAAAALLCACSSSNPAPDLATDSFAKGADVGWLSQLEAEGHKFFSQSGKEMECMQLLRDSCGVNSIRLRVWVHPKDGWNSPEDVLYKAKRADSLGMRLMIDFHFSDHWADPGQQVTPEAWQGLDLDALQDSMTAHIHHTLGLLKDAGITAEWVQIGNETADGFMYPLGQISTYPENFARLVTAGHHAVKEVFPDAKTIVHTDRGERRARYDYVMGTLREHGAEYDMIGVSCYPWPIEQWSQVVDSLTSNIARAKTDFGKPVMICEIGFPVTATAEATAMMQKTYDAARADSLAEGIFWWEPEAPFGCNGGYDKGCFIDGKPTSVLDCFKNN